LKLPLPFSLLLMLTVNAVVKNKPVVVYKTQQLPFSLLVSCTRPPDAKVNHLVVVY
jgi:hypothetical protein